MKYCPYDDCMFQKYQHAHQTRNTITFSTGSTHVEVTNANPVTRKNTTNSQRNRGDTGETLSGFDEKNL